MGCWSPVGTSEDKTEKDASDLFLFLPVSHCKLDTITVALVNFFVFRTVVETVMFD